MPSIAMSGNDTLSINNHVFTSFSDKDVATLTFPNDIAQVKTGKNGNSIYGLNESGRQCELTVRVLRGSSDDKFLNGLYSQQTLNFSGFILMIGALVKKIGDGKGNITSDTYVLSGGIFQKEPEAKINVEGDTDQSIVEWALKFANAPRAIT